MNYLDVVAVEIRAIADPRAEPPYDDLLLYRIYALLALAKGAEVTAEDVHDAWVAWATLRLPESQWLKPFDHLPRAVQQMDEPFAAAIRQVATWAHAREETPP
jgi:hypothetical protein